VLTHENVGVVDLLGAASLVVSQAALDALAARAEGRSDEGAADDGSSPTGGSD
jgi:hypothetical protein